MTPPEIAGPLLALMEKYRAQLTPEGRLTFDVVTHAYRHEVLYGHEVDECGDVEHNAVAVKSSRRLRN